MLMVPAFRKSGHTVKVYSFKRQFPKLLFPGKTQLDESKNQPTFESLALIDSINPFSWIQTGLAIRKQNPDKLIVMYWIAHMAPCYATIAFIVRWRRKTKIFYVCHEVRAQRTSLFEKILSYIAFLFVDVFIAMARSEVEVLKRIKPNTQCLHIQHPKMTFYESRQSHDEARKQLDIALDAHVALFFGFIKHYKGLDVLLKSMVQANKQMPIHLLVAGEFYEEEKICHDIVKEGNIQEYVTFSDGYLPNELVDTYFAASDIVVLPYRSTTQSGVLMLAYQFGRPMLITNAGGLSEFVDEGETGFVIPPNDPHIMAETLVKFFKEDRGEKMREFVRNKKDTLTTWDEFVKAVETTV